MRFGLGAGQFYEDFRKADGVEHGFLGLAGIDDGILFDSAKSVSMLPFGEGEDLAYVLGNDDNAHGVWLSEIVGDDGNLTFALTLKTEVHPRQPRPAAKFTLPPDVPRNHLPGEVRTSCPAQ